MTEAHLRPGEFLGASEESLVTPDESDFPALWMQVPRQDQVPDAAAWAREAAPRMASDRHIEDPETVEGLRAMLEVLALQPTRLTEAVRLLFMPYPDFGGVVYEVVAARADGDRAATGPMLVGADAPAPLGRALSEFAHENRIGLQCTRFHSEVSGADRTIVASTTATVRWPLSPADELDLVAYAETSDLEALAMSLVPLQHLLCSEVVLELLLHDNPTHTSSRNPAAG